MPNLRKSWQILFPGTDVNILCCCNLFLSLWKTCLWLKHDTYIYKWTWTWTWKGVLQPHVPPGWIWVLCFMTVVHKSRHTIRHIGLMAAVSWRVNEMTELRSRREHATCQELKLQIYDCLVSELLHKSRKKKIQRPAVVMAAITIRIHNGVMSAITGAIICAGALRAPIWFLSSCALFFFLSSPFVPSSPSKISPGPWDGPRIGARAPTLSLLKTTAGAGSKRDRGRGEGPDDERYRHHHLLPVKQFVIELSL